MKVGFFGGKFLPLHIGHIHTLTRAVTEVDKLYFILFSSENRDRYFCDRDGIDYIPPEERLRWMGEVVGDLEMVKILHLTDVNQGRDDGDHYNWKKGTDQVKEAIPEKITHIFGGKDGYPFEKYYPDADPVMFDKVHDGLSATKIRQEGIYENWEYLPPAVRRHFVLKVAVVGTESCGKTTLVKLLAKTFNTNYVHEVGREYCEIRKDQLTPEMFDHIAFEHILEEEKKSYHSNKILFVDTEALVTQYYLNMYFGDRSMVIDSIVGSMYHNYDLILYMKPDVDWVDDGLRFNEGEGLRRTLDEKLSKMFLTEREWNEGTAFITGDYSNRFETALNVIEKVTEGSIRPA